MTLTKENLEELFNQNAPNSPQLKLLGLRYPLKRGWMRDLIGTEMNELVYAQAKALKGRRPRGMPKTQWRKATCRPGKPCSASR
jgi:hypothetical protein